MQRVIRSNHLVKQLTTPKQGCPRAPSRSFHSVFWWVVAYGTQLRLYSWKHEKVTWSQVGTVGWVREFLNQIFGEKIFGLVGPACWRVVMVKQETTQTSPLAMRHDCIQDLGQTVLDIPVGSDYALRILYHNDHMTSAGHENGDHLLRCTALPSELDWWCYTCRGPLHRLLLHLRVETVYPGLVTTNDHLKTVVLEGALSGSSFRKLLHRGARSSATASGHYAGRTRSWPWRVLLGVP